MKEDYTMPEDNNPSPGAGVTPSSGTPATGTPASSSATLDPKPSLSLEEAIKKLADAEHSLNNAKEENARHSKKLSAYEKAEKEAAEAKKAAEEAQLTEIERTKKQYADLQAQHDTYTRQMQERIVRYEVERQAAKLGIIDPEAATKLLDWAELEYDEDGTPKNADKLLEKLVKNKPYLAPAPAQPTPTPAQTAPTPTAPATPAMNPGRSNIVAPGSTTPGRIPTWGDIYKRP